MADKAQSLPVHLGLIIDGNRRWARANGLPKLEGHRQGYLVLKKIIKAAIDRGVTYVSAYTFSTENWNRTTTEVKYLMDMALGILTKDVEELHKEGIRVCVAGSRTRLSQQLVAAIDDAENKTRDNSRGTLLLCFNYGGQGEIVDSVNALIKKRAVDISAKDISAHLYAPDIPPVDFIIRTSGEQRLSNFMLWRSAYAELLFVEKHWPDFNEVDLDKALADYARRQRRFGK